MRKLVLLVAISGMALGNASVFAQLSTGVGGAGAVLPNLPTTNTNVGIGNNAPALKLDIKTAAQNDGIRVQQTGTTIAALNLEASTGRRWALFSTGSANPEGAGNFGLFDYGGAAGASAGYRLFVKGSNGNVGIGTTNPTARLEVNSGVSCTSGLKLTNLPNTCATTAGNGKVLSVDASGNVILVPSATSSNNIYNSNGTLAANRTVTMSGKNLSFISGPSSPNLPNSPFFINGTNGNVGIGTNTPSGQLSFANTIYDKKIVLWQATNAASTNYDGFGIAASTLRYQVDEPGSSHVFYAADAALNATGSNELMRIQGDGKVGIGINPASCGGTGFPSNYRLYVKDGILTEKLKVALACTANWSDYVFAPDYQLKPLSEVEAFVKENKHLPNVPSAEQLVKDGGIDVNEMFAKQMEKIEELTLYIIEQHKQAEAQSKQIETQSKQMEQLQTRISQLEKQ